MHPRANPCISRGFAFLVHGNARCCIGKMQPKMQPVFGGRGACKMVLSDLEVMPLRYGLTVADPLANDLDRERLGQFRFTGGAKILEKLRPRLQPGADDPCEVGSQVRRVAFQPVVSRE